MVTLYCLSVEEMSTPIKITMNILSFHFFVQIILKLYNDNYIVLN